MFSIDGTDVNIRIRIGNASDGDPYRNATFAEAVAALQGVHQMTDDDGHGYHIRCTVLVVACYAQEYDESHGPKRILHRRYDEPLFGQGVTVYGRDVSFGQYKDCEVSMASIGSHNVAVGRLRLSLLRLAVNLAEVASAKPECVPCAAYLAKLHAAQDVRKAQPKNKD